MHVFLRRLNSTFNARFTRRGTGIVIPIARRNLPNFGPKGNKPVSVEPGVTASTRTLCTRISYHSDLLKLSTYTFDAL